MIESLITISIVGLVTGIVLTMPVAGPISIFITSHGLKGRFRYCVLAAIGAAIVDFVYCFIAVFGFTQLYIAYRPMFPYVFLVGSVFLLVVGVKIMRSKIKTEQLDTPDTITEKIRHHGGFWTGFMLNFLNPSLLIGWLVSSVAILSFVASMGFNIGGLDTVIHNNADVMNHYNDMHHIRQHHITKDTVAAAVPAESPETLRQFVKTHFPVITSLAYAFAVAVGTVIWFYFYALFLVKFGQTLRLAAINWIIHLLGLAMCGFGVYMAYQAVTALLAGH